MDSYLRAILYGSVGARINLWREPGSAPIGGILTQASEIFVVALEKAPPAWFEQRLLLHCELLADGGLLHFTVMAWLQAERELAFAPPRSVRLVRVRNHVRIPLDEEVILLPTEVFGVGHRAQDISIGGMALATAAPLLIGDRLRVAFVAQPWQELGALTARVVRCVSPQPPAFGLAFVGLTMQQQGLLRQLALAALKRHREARREQALRFLR